MSPPVQKVQTILGTMIFGKSSETKPGSTAPSVTDIKKIEEIFNSFYSHGLITLDTARMYCAGETEEIMGDLGVSKAIVHTKAYPNPKMNSVTLRDQLENSLKALKRNSVELFYLHWPDRTTPIKETLKAVNDLHKEGKFKEFGLSNFSSWEVAEICTICQYEGWIAPSVYQGMYNAITRDIERELIPCLRRFNMRFYAYNPLAGGLLAKSYNFENLPEQGRFTGDNAWGQRYRERYWKKEAFDGLSKLSETCKKHNIDIAEASLRWIYNHSQLKDEFADGVIIGASKLEHLQENLKSAMNRELLPQEVVDALDDACAIFRPVCPTYFR